MDIDKIKVGKNIKILRKIYRETQEELAFAIGLPGKSTIANYESFRNVPKKEILYKIALHYRISIEDLIQHEFEFKADISNINIRTLVDFFPFISSEKALQNKNFAKAYKLTDVYIDSFKKDFVMSEQDWQNMFTNYEKAVNDDVIEASANLLFFFIFIFEPLIKNPRFSMLMQENTNALKGGYENLIKKFYLKDMDEPIFAHESFLDQKEIDELNEFILETLKKLKSDPKLSDLADYYIALRYMAGCPQNDLSDEANLQIGAEMLNLLFDLDNKYAINYFVKLFEMIYKNK